LDQRKRDYEHRADPKIHRVQRQPVFRIIEAKQCPYACDKSEQSNRGMPPESESFFKEGNYGLQHRDTTGDRCQKEHKEPAKPKETPARHLSKHVWQSVKA
jgi:hypothetical protein